MSYATNQNLVDDFGAREIAEISVPQDLTVLSASQFRVYLADPGDAGLSADEIISGAAAVAKIDQAIAEADSEIDGYLRTGGYITPIASDVPEMIVSISKDLARYDLHKERPTEAVKDRRVAARQLLKDIATGKLTISVSMNSGGPVGISVSATDQVFTDDVLALYA